jgi:hypothetical protein
MAIDWVFRSAIVLIAVGITGWPARAAECTKMEQMQETILAAGGRIAGAADYAGLAAMSAPSSSSRGSNQSL